MTYEVMAKQASDEFLKSGTPPAKFIAKMASERGLNSEQVHRVCELANHQINASMAKDASDQLFTFPVATVEGVFGAMDKGSQAKAASAPGVQLDGGIYAQLDALPNYAEIVASRRFSQKLASEKVAETPAPEVSYRAQLHEAEQMHKKASAEFDYQQLALREHLSRMRGLFGKMATADSKEDFLLAAGVVLGQPAAEKLAEEFGLGKVTIEGIDKVASYIDHSHDLVKELDSFKRTIDNYMSAKDELDKTAEAMDTIRRAMDKGKELYAKGKAKGKVLVQKGKAELENAVEMGKVLKDQFVDWARPGAEAFQSYKPVEALKRAVTHPKSMGRLAAKAVGAAAVADAAGLGAEQGAKFVLKSHIATQHPVVHGAYKLVKGSKPIVQQSMKEAL